MAAALTVRRMPEELFRRIQAYVLGFLSGQPETLLLSSSIDSVARVDEPPSIVRMITTPSH